MRKKYTIKVWHILLTAILSVAIPVAFVATMAKAQSDPLTESCNGHHKSQMEFYDEIRLLPPLTVTSVVGNRVEYLVVGEGLTLGSLDLEKDYSVVPTGFNADHHSGCYGVMYCHRHKIVLSVEPLDPKQCKLVKN